VVGGWGENAKKRAREREAIVRRGWETTSPSGLRLPNDPRDRARVTFGPFGSKSRAELSVDAQFGSARPARRKGDYFICVWASCVCILTHDPRNWRSVLLPAKNSSITLRSIPRGGSDLIDLKIKNERNKGILLWSGNFSLFVTTPDSNVWIFAVCEFRDCIDCERSTREQNVWWIALGTPS